MCGFIADKTPSCYQKGRRKLEKRRQRRQSTCRQNGKYIALVESQLFDLIRNMCVEPGKMCMSEMMAIDAQGGLGLAGIATTLPLSYDKHARRGTVFGDAPAPVAGDWLFAAQTAGISTSLSGDGAQRVKAEDRRGEVMDVYDWDGWPCRVLPDDQFIGRLQKPTSVV